MDGQLDGDQQHLVESALVANPQLAEQLRGLTAAARPRGRLGLVTPPST